MRNLLAVAISLLCCCAVAQAAEETGAPADGALVHFELPSTDFQRTKEFYGGLFDWTFPSMEGMPGMEGMEEVYLLFATPGGEGGGFTKDYQPGEGGGVFYIYAADVAAKLAEVVAAGGTVILDAMPVPSVGWIALFADPDGNKVGLFSSANVPTPEEAAAAMGSEGI